MKSVNKEYKTYQINLKISEKLLEETQEYSKDFGYKNVQELIREAIREKVIEREINPNYLKKLLIDKDFNEGIGVCESKSLLDKMKRKNTRKKRI